MTIPTCRFSGCENPQPLENTQVHPYRPSQIGGTCPHCNKFSWAPIEKNENKRTASQRAAKEFLERNSLIRCYFCGIEKEQIPDGQTLECAHIIDHADGGPFNESNIIPLCTRCHKLQHHIRHWWI